MPILRGCDVFVLAAMRIHVIRDTFRDGIATGYTQFAAFANVGCTSTMIKAFFMFAPFRICLLTRII